MNETTVDLNTPPHSNLNMDLEILESVEVPEQDEGTPSASETSNSSTEVVTSPHLIETTSVKFDIENTPKSRTDFPQLISRQCFICGTDFKAAREDCKKSVKSCLGKRLHDIFILKILFEVPYKILEKYLVNQGDSIDTWFSMCPNCIKIIDLSKDVYDELLKITRKFKSLKKIIVDKVKESVSDGNSLDLPNKSRRGRKRKQGHSEIAHNLTEETRNFIKKHKYPTYNDPFLEGDIKATQLLASSYPNCSEETKNDIHGKVGLTFLYLPKEDEDCSPTTPKSDTRPPSSPSVDDGEEEIPDGAHEIFELSSDDDEGDQDDEDNDPSFTEKSLMKSKKSSRARRPVASSNNSDAETNFLEHLPPTNSNRESRMGTRGPYDKSVRFTCPYCEQYRFRMMKGELFCQHLETCEGLEGEKKEKLLCCPVCQKFKRKLGERTQFVEHLPMCFTEENKLPLSLRVFTCDLCTEPDKKYFKLDGFLAHYAYHKKYCLRCEFCKAKLLDKKQGRQHLRQHHSESFEHSLIDTYIIEVNSLPTVIWWCPLCPDSSFTKESLRDSHMKSEHPDFFESRDKSNSKSHRCQFCSKIYWCPDELEFHEGTEHVSVKALFQCEVCFETFRKEKFLRHHRASKHRLDLLVCDICGLGCMNNKTLQTHMQLHQEKRNHLCPHEGCDQSFTTKYFLKCHLFKEHGDKDDPKKNPNLCHICKKVFHKRAYLLKHIRETHERNYDLACELCGRGLQNSSHLKRHLSQHHGIGEYGKHKCTYEGCNRVFWYRSILRLHLTQHTKEPQFKCGYCGKEFYFKNQLQRHELIHTNAETKPYQCEICAKRFPVRNYLYIHMRSHKKDSMQ